MLGWLGSNAATNAIAFLALIISGFAYQQSAKANDTANAERASHVSIEYTNTPFRQISIANHSKDPIDNVQFTFTVDGDASPKTAFLGQIAPCLIVPLTAKGYEQMAGFKPHDLLFRDSQGNNWKRDESNHITKNEDDPYDDREHLQIQSGTPIPNC